MIRLAILETEEFAKEILFFMMHYLPQRAWSFEYFTRISEFAKRDKVEDFQIVVFHEKFDTVRISQAFVLNKPRRITIYVKEQISEALSSRYPYQRIFYINRKNIKYEIQLLVPFIEKLLRKEEEYLLNYHDVSVPMKINDIYYIEKEGKLLVYHTKLGEFKERKNMKDMAIHFAPYDFLWIHVTYLVNMQYITKIQGASLYLGDIELPISRAKKSTIIHTLHQLAKIDDP